MLYFGFILADNRADVVRIPYSNIASKPKTTRDAMELQEFKTSSLPSAQEAPDFTLYSEDGDAVRYFQNLSVRRTSTLILM